MYIGGGRIKKIINNFFHMEKNTSKFIIIGMIGLFFLGAFLYGTKTDLKGEFIATNAASITCGNTWTKQLEGRYKFDPQKNTNTAGPIFYGANTEQIRELAKLVKQGCDMKIQMEERPQGKSGMRETSVACDATQVMGEVNKNPYVICQFHTPLPNGGFQFGNYLYDEFAFVGLDPIQIYKTRYFLKDGSDIPTSVSFFSTTNAWDQNIDWKVEVFLKK